MENRRMMTVETRRRLSVTIRTMGKKRRNNYVIKQA